MRKSTQVAFLERLAEGLPVDTAARLADTDADAVASWRKHSRRFDSRVRRALAEGKATLIERVAAGQPGWRASAWLLERIHPDEFGPPEMFRVPSAPPENLTDDLPGL
jgi:hypothetical protein